MPEQVPIKQQVQLLYQIIKMEHGKTIKDNCVIKTCFLLDTTCIKLNSIIDVILVYWMY